MSDVFQMKKPDLCISSVYVKEAGFKDYRFSAYKAAEELGFNVFRNPEDTGANQNLFEDTLNNKHPVFILLVGEQDSEVVRRECELALDNCLPLLIFLKVETHGAIDERTKSIVKEISKIAYDGDCTLFTNCEELHKQVKARLIDYSNKRNMAYPIIDSNVGSAYESSSILIHRTKRRIVLYQKTSSLVLGPRVKNRAEEMFYSELIRWIKNRQNNMEFLHVFSSQHTLSALKNPGSEYNIDKYRTPFIRLCKQYDKSSTFSIRASDSIDDISYVITDTDVLLVIPMGSMRCSITLPFYLMRNSEVKKINSVLSGSGTSLMISDIENLYT